MATGLILDLNKTTRFSSLPLGAADDAAGVVQASGWSTGFPVRTSFGRGFPEHDTWRFDADRLVESGEADAALWISAYGERRPHWKQQIPLVALVPPRARNSPPSRRCASRSDAPASIMTARNYAREVGAIVAREAALPSDASPRPPRSSPGSPQHIGGEA